MSLPTGAASYQDITIAGFVYWNGGSAWQRIFDFGNDTSNYLFLTPYSGTGIQFSINEAGVTQQLTTTSALPSGQSVHVAVTISGSTGTLYVNGVAVATNTSMTFNPSDIASTLNYLGKSQYSADPLFSGMIDDFRIYNYALTAAQVATIASPTPIAPTGLTGTGKYTQNILTWNAAQAATTYTVKRSLTSGGPYTNLATGLTTTTYTDTGLTNGVTYYYVVSATNANGESPNSTETAATPSDLLLYLKFDETSGSTAYDSGSNGFNGTTVNSPTWVTGKFSNALSFASASSQYLTLPSGIVSSLTTCTFSAWVNLTTESTWCRVFDFGTGTSTNMFLTGQNASGKVRFAIIASGTAEQDIDGTAAIPTGGWHHVAVTLNGATGTLYVDGVQVGQKTNMTLNPSSLGTTTQNYLGKSQWSADPYLNGMVDDFRIYSRALSTREIGVVAAGFPTAPTNVVATPGPLQIGLTWNTVANASSYAVQYATTSGGPYTTLATGLTSPAYTHTGLTFGTTYYYVVTASGLAGTSTTSTEVSATPASPLVTDTEKNAITTVFGVDDGGSPIATVTVPNSVVGHTYQLFTTTSLASGTWTTVGSAQSGTGSALTFIADVDTTVPTAYFKIVIQR
ncbi:MAG: LamG domain-containing protein [Chthoniobacteraceae bacterium]